MSTTWKNYYTRSTRLQDFEVPIVLPIWSMTRLITQVLYIHREGKWEAWYKELEWMSWMKKMSQEILKPGWTITKHLSEFKIASRNLHNSARILSQKAKSRSSNQECIKPYRGLLERYNQFAPFIWTPWAITFWLEDWFINELKKVRPDWNIVYESLAHTPRPIEMELLERALLAWRIKRGTQKELRRLSVRFGYLAAYSVNNDMWTADDLKKQALQFKNPSKTLKELDRSAIENKKQARKTLASLNSCPLLKKIGEVIYLYTWLRTQRVDVYKHTMAYSFDSYRAIEKRLNIPKFSAADLTHNEIMVALKTGRLPSPAKLKTRAKNGYVALMTKAKTIVVPESEKQLSFVHKFIPDYGIVNTREAHGKTAYPGIVRGRIRRIIHFTEVKDMRPGEILVANTTHPNYMPAIRLAAAIVTDEGGIVCHAAIISRELKIPCVIGAGSATKTFATGDLVEVDATSGIVKKI